MLPTGLVVVPDSQCDVGAGLRIAGEYARIAYGVFGNRHKLYVFNGDAILLRPGEKPPLRAGSNAADDNLDAIQSTLTSIYDANQPQIHTGRLLLICCDGEHPHSCISDVSNESISNWAKSLVRGHEFDFLIVEVVTFLSLNDYEEQLPELNTSVKIVHFGNRPNQMKIAQAISIAHFKLSTMTIPGISLFFFDPFETRTIDACKFIQVSRSALVPYVSRSWLAAFQSANSDGKTFLSKDVCIIDQLYLLSMNGDVLTLSEIDQSYQNQDDEAAAFTASSEVPYLVDLAPIALQVAPGREMWEFKRDSVPPPLYLYFSLVNNTPKYLFSPTVIDNTKLRKLLRILLDAVIGPVVTEAKREGFEAVIRAFHSNLPQLMTELFQDYNDTRFTPSDIISYSLYELGQILEALSNASPSHKRIRDIFYAACAHIIRSPPPA